MADNVELNDLSEVDFLKKMQASVQRHISNLENTIAMMRNGHFIDSFQRINGSKEGLCFIKQAMDERVASRIQKSETDSNK